MGSGARSKGLPAYALLLPWQLRRKLHGETTSLDSAPFGDARALLKAHRIIGAEYMKLLSFSPSGLMWGIPEGRAEEFL